MAKTSLQGRSGRKEETVEGRGGKVESGADSQETKCERGDWLRWPNAKGGRKRVHFTGCGTLLI